MKLNLSKTFELFYQKKKIILTKKTKLCFVLLDLNLKKTVQVLCDDKPNK